MSISVKGSDCLMNGSFETLSEGLPVNWNYYAPGTTPNSDFGISADSAVYKEGRKSLRFTVRKCESVGGWHSPGFFEEFKVLPGETYMISFWALNKGCRYKVNISTGMKGNPGIYDSIVMAKESNAEWQYYERDFTVPKSNENLRFEANILSPGKIWFDDIRIQAKNDTNTLKLYPYRGKEECE